jgi:hypothetical protein
VDFWFGNWSGAFEKIEVATLVGLLDVLHKEFAVASGIDAFFRPPGGAAASEFVVTDKHVQLPRRDIQFDEVPFVEKREWPADE